MVQDLAYGQAVSERLQGRAYGPEPSGGGENKVWLSEVSVLMLQGLAEVLSWYAPDE